MPPTRGRRCHASWPRWQRLGEIWNHLPLSDIDVISDAQRAPRWTEWLTTEPGDPRWHRSPSLATGPDAGDVALLQIGGYRDFAGAGITTPPRPRVPTRSRVMFALAQALGDSPRHHFVAGPWTHRGVYSGATGARELPETSSPAGPLGWGPVLAAWFDIHLRGGDGSGYPLGLPWVTGQPVHYYVEGRNTWADAPSWPPPGARQEWLLGSGGNARSAAGDGVLVLDSGTTPASASDAFRDDPHDPFPTCGGALGLPFQGPDGIQDQRAVDGRSDVLVYTSPPLTAPATVVGAAELVVHLETNSPDTDLVAKLVDVEPDGFAYNVSEGALRTRYRNGGSEDWLTPGAPQEVSVRLHDTAHTFLPGHRIRVMLAGANFPRLSRNLHTTTVPELGTLEEADAADLTVHVGEEFPSRLVVSLAAD